jgi:hypothetical protein
LEVLTRSYTGDAQGAAGGRPCLLAGIESGVLTAGEVLDGYCALLHDRFGTHEEVARRTGLDRRTARKHVLAWRARDGRRSQITQAPTQLTENAGRGGDGRVP